MVIYKLPLNEIVFDFYDRLKSISRGYASFRLPHCRRTRKAHLVKLSILVNAEPVDALSIIVHRGQAEYRGRMRLRASEGPDPTADCSRSRSRLPSAPRSLPAKPISAMRKDVTAKCYGGDITRKKKLLEKQKAGKKKMRQFGNVEIPQSAFIAALKMGDD